MDEVIISSSTEHADSVSRDDVQGHKPRAVCQLCLQNSARYTCPRCNIQYCSITCYKAVTHAHCSEEFYKNCFIEGLNEQHASVEERNKMLEMLMRLETEQPADLDSDDDDVPSLEDRLSGLDLDKDSDLDLVWEKLTSNERTEFQTMIQNGCLGNLVSPWEPWWTHKENELIEEVDSDIVLHQMAAPDIITDAPLLSKLLNDKQPSDQIKFSVLNCLYGYAYVARIYNGDHHGNHSQGAAQEIVNLCGGLSNAVFSSTSEALQGCIQALHQKAVTLHSDPGVSIAVMRDLIRLVEGPSKKHQNMYTLAALSDLHRLIRKAKHSTDKYLKGGKLLDEEKAETVKLKRRFFTAQKKVHFLISWVQSDHNTLLPLVPEIELEFCMMSSEFAAHSETKEKMEKHWGGKMRRKATQLITEIS